MSLRNIAILTVGLVAAGVLYYFTSQTEIPPPAKPRHFVWDVEMEELAKMAISLPPLGKKETWVKHDDRYWYFDKPGGPKVNMKRWGGGIPLLLSGPGAERLIADNASDEKLGIFGLVSPSMQIDLTLENRKSINIDVGDHTPDAQGFYVKLRKSRDVYTVHESWYHVLERLVLDPPYPDPDEKPKPVDPQVQARIKKEAETASANRERGDNFRLKYKDKSGVKELESGLLYRVIKKGSGSVPTLDDTVKVLYTGRLIDDTIFDSTKDGEAITFRLDGIIRGWREALQLMKEGGHWEIVIPPELGYGRKGSGGSIGANETLVFEIELLEIM